MSRRTAISRSWPPKSRLGRLDVAHGCVHRPALGEQPPHEVVAVLAGRARDDGGASAATRAAQSRAGRYPSAPCPCVLFTCAGQRVDIVEAFGRAGATTLAADLNELAPALYAADRRAMVPPVDDPGYIAALAALVEEHGVDLIVPLADLDHRAARRARATTSARWCCCPGPRRSRSARTSTRRTASSSATACRRRRPGSRTSCRTTSPFPCS